MPAISVDDFRKAMSEFTKRPVPVVTAADTLTSLHLDSLAMLEIIGQLEEQHGIGVDEDDLVEIQSVGDLLAVLNRAKPVQGSGDATNVAL